MKNILTLAFCLSFGIGSSAPASPVSDATYIVEQHMIAGNYEEKSALLLQDTLKSLRPALEQLGAKIIDSDRFLGELVGDYLSEFMHKTQNDAVAIYQEVLTPKELAMWAEFYRSTEGQDLLMQSYEVGPLEASNDFFKTELGETMLIHAPDLLASIEKPILEALADIDEIFSMGRIADILEIEGIVVFDDESRRRVVIDAMRKAG